MSIVFNGVTVGSYSGNLVANGVNATKAYINGVLAWQVKAPPGSQTFTASGTFTVPTGYTQVTICMCGGGGSGASGEAVYAGGGYAGAIQSQVVAVTPGANISVVIGAGGTSVSGDSNGHVGTASSFGAISAAGGAGGSIVSPNNYRGNGASRVTCGGTFYDGLKTGYYYGGQAGAFGNGGRYNLAGGVGAGGGAGVGVPSGVGGRGQCVVSWA